MPLRRLIFDLRTRLSSDPSLFWLYQPYIWWDQIKSGLRYGAQDAREHRLRADTELVIDGFQGSANSYAADLFKSWQTRDVAMSHHMHAAAQIVRAVRRDLPTVVTIREPAQAVLSTTARWPHLDVAQVLRGYVAFYRALLPVADGIVLSPFDRTIHDFGGVVADVNVRFGTAFATGTAVAGMAVTGDGASADVEAIRAARKATNPEQERRRAEKQADLDSKAALLAQANAVYAALIDACGVTPPPVPTPTS
ncbi:MAG: hypothetical protein AAF809_04350 [Bacteroidota bacterium]